jgi:hypothetical protein
LPLEAIDTTDSFVGILAPVFKVLRILAYYTHLAVEQTDTVLQRNNLARGRVVTADDIRTFTATEFKAALRYIIQPRLASCLGETNGLRVGSPCMIFVLLVKDILTTKPSLVDEVILRIAYPRRSEDLGLLLDTTLLFLFTLDSTRTHNAVVLACDITRMNLVRREIAITATLVIGGSPKDMIVMAKMLERVVVTLILMDGHYALPACLVT